MPRSPSPRSIFATNHDMGSAQAMVPALRKLKEMGLEVVTSAIPEAPAFGVFTAAGFEPKMPSFDSMFLTDRPDLVLVGISVNDQGSEKLVLRAALDAEVPTAFIVETWPHRWLEVYGARDLPLYTRADLAMLPDDVSCEHMVSMGFNRTALAATGNPSQDSFATFAKDRVRHRAEMRDRLRIPEEAVVIQWSVALDLDDPEQDKPGHTEWSGFCEKDSIKEFLTAIREVNVEKPLRKVVGVIRQKPTHGSTLVRGLIRDICPEVIFDNGRETGIPLILASDIVCGPVTMMVQNAAMLGVPGVFYLPDLCKPDPMIANKIGFTIPKYTRGDLRRLIRDAGHTMNLVETLHKSVRPIHLPTDATDRVVEEIVTFVDSSSA